MHDGILKLRSKNKSSCGLLSSGRINLGDRERKGAESSAN